MFGDVAEYAISSIENNDKLFTLNCEKEKLAIKSPISSAFILNMIFL